MKNVYLVMVTAQNNNKYYNMTDNNDGTFTVQYGRVGKNPTICTYSINDWNKKYNEKIRKGYVDRTEMLSTNTTVEVKDNKGKEFKVIPNLEVRELVNDLLSYAKKVIKKYYTISSDVVTEVMVKKAQIIIDDLSKNISVVEFNRLLLQLFETIPRSMSNVNDYLAQTKDDYSRILQREQNLLDTMNGQVITPIIAKKSSGVSSDKTILEEMGLIVEPVSAEAEGNIKKHLGEIASKFEYAYRVVNSETQEAYDKYIKDNNITNTKMYYHGSRNENWWNILCTGLKLRPSNVIINGKMFGYEIYMAPKAKKSCGYTSCSDSCCTSGNANTGYIAVYDVAYGNPCDVYNYNNKYSSFTYDKLKREQSNADCLHAHAGASLKNDEVIVYKEEQVTIHYLIKLKSK